MLAVHVRIYIYICLYSVCVCICYAALSLTQREISLYTQVHLYVRMAFSFGHGGLNLLLHASITRGNKAYLAGQPLQKRLLDSVCIHEYAYMWEHKINVFVL